MVDSAPVVIIGAGIAGLATGARLTQAGVASMCLESRAHWGGHCASEVVDGFVFDEGPHVSFTADPRVRTLFAKSAGRVRRLRARLTNYFDGRWVRHPAQCHLHGLPSDLIVDCMLDLTAAQTARDVPPANYAEWCLQTYGRTFAERFVFEYTRKYWTVEPAALGTDWIGKRMYAPSLRDVFRGGVASGRRADCHYLQEFSYPSTGGFQSFLSGLHRLADVRVSATVTEIDVRDRCVRCADGSSVGFDHLVSSMPLPALIAAVARPRAPADVLEAAAALDISSALIVDIALNTSDVPRRSQIFYVYDRDMSIARVSCPHLLSPNNVPAGCASLQAEIYYSRYRPLDGEPASYAARAVEELQRMRVIRRSGDVRWARVRVLPHANVLFTARRSDALRTIRAWLARIGVRSIGRYGEWAYFWTDDAIRSGWSAADEIVQSMERAASARPAAADVPAVTIES
jgi:protoporphyrinogen oxidase